MIRTVDQALVAQVDTGASPYGEAGGLSLYFPNPMTASSFERSSESYVNYGLSFLADTRWDEFLGVLFGSQSVP